ncbi:hypothetical protein [Paludibacterium sp. B53371]|uniref:hypothetical protein n=1 Tax=Paludibacterium sp. B53371 TaxID=2806263 RepID=UPI001C03D481|nr:hypothetical protein [Paludibacterium sp. B53371]
MRDHAIRSYAPTPPLAVIPPTSKDDLPPLDCRPPCPGSVRHTTTTDPVQREQALAQATRRSEQLGVKRAWYAALGKVGFAGISLLGLGLTIAASGGIAAAVVGGVLATIMIGDACCALYNFRQTRRQQPPLPMGNDLVANGIYGLCHALGTKDKTAIELGTAASLISRVSLMIASGCLPFVHPANSSSQAVAVLGGIVTPILSAASRGMDITSDMFAALKSKSDEQLAALPEVPTEVCHL